MRLQDPDVHPSRNFRLLTNSPKCVELRVINFNIEI
jgi:hypothetical protein